MERSSFSQDFKKLDFQEQATFIVLGAVDTVFNTLTNAFTAIAGVADSIGGFAREGGRDVLSKESVTDLLGVNFKTDKPNGSENQKTETAVPAKATSIPIAPPKASPVAIKKS